MSKSSCISTAFGGKTKDDLIHQAHEARQAREHARKLDSAANKVKAFLKAVQVRQRLKREAFRELEEVTRLSTFPNHIHPLQFIRKLLFVCDPIRDRTTLDTLIQFIVSIAPDRRGTLEELDEARTGLEIRLSENTVAGDAKESIELSSEHIVLEVSNDKQSVHVNSPRTLLDLVYRDITERDIKLEDWIHVLEGILNLCLQYLKDHNSNRLDSQLICYYLQVIDILTSGYQESLTFNNHVSTIPSHFLDQIAHELLERCLRTKKNPFKHITTLINERINRLRNDLKSSVLRNYTRLVIRLLGLFKKSDQEILPHAKLSSSELLSIILGMLCIPGFISYLEKHSKESINAINSNSIFKISMKLLVEQDLQKLTSTSAVCLLANFVHMAHLSEDVLIEETLTFVILMTKLLETCQKNMLLVSSALVSGNPRLSIPKTGNNKKKNESPDVSFNPLLGWLAREQVASIDKDTIKSQLSHLWSLRFLKILLRDLVAVNERKVAISSQSAAQTSSPRHRSSIFLSRHSSNQPETETNKIAQPEVNQTSPLGLFKRVVERAATTMSKTVYTSYAKTTGLSTNSGTAKLMTPEASRISLVCFMLQMTLKTLTTLRQDILTGLCFHNFILPNLWTFICSLGPHNGLRAFLEYLTIYTKTSSPEFHILILFCECASHLISILDDTELYEKQEPFRLEDLVAISSFLNNFVFRIIWNNLIPINAQDMDPALQSTHKLLTYLYKRDCRRKFAPQDHWLIKDVKLSIFLKDLDAGKPIAKTIMNMIPHIIPHKERVLIYRKLVAKDKSQYASGPSTVITIHRSRIVEDGYQQLARLPPNALKGLIRVKFINDFGLDEAGIDQDGVFKEFLEDTIKRVFDPALNLFCSTSEQRLYPSPTSRLHEDYLSLFNFVGKMLGKAIYEGIVVDVPFATFFLNRVLGQHHSHLYSPIDELPSLDPELYKSLTYIKHYEGDVSELDLTFSIDQDFMGKIETHELESGGTSIPVTRESRVRYIHSVANFRMKTQIEKQTDAFVSGFKSIINIEWLTMFSASELQRLISGDNTPIDLQDLRRHTKYFGGFHNNHKVVCWLWDILEKDFSAEEHRLFLKFVTSCSKPPLLGFANLEPPFSIRCVEVSDDQDLGDTLGSVLRGFLAMRQRDPVDRLPTSSTCFNLLKLPNYQRRSTLREKLRYAIKSNPGFELS